MTQMNKRPDSLPRQGARPQAQRRAPAGGAVRRGASTGGANVRRPSASRSRGPGRELAILAVGGLIVVALAFFLQQAWPNGFPLRVSGSSVQEVREVTEIHTAGPLRINEVMSGNRRTLSTGDGSTPDWIEVANVSGSPLNLKGYALSQAADAVNVFTFPEM